MPLFATEDVLEDWLWKKSTKPKEQVEAECRKVLHEARKQFEDATYLY